MKNEGKYIAVDSYNKVNSVVYFDRATGEQIFKAETLPDGRVIKI